MLHTVFLLASLLQPAASDQEVAPTERFSLYGQGRMRAEGTWNQLNGTDRYRGRMRLRIGAHYEIAEGLRSEVRLSTVNDGSDARSPYWDFGDGASGFGGAEVAIDRFYLAWEATEELDVRVGKIPHAFSAPPIFSEFTWDADLHPDGVSAVWAPQAEEGGAHWDVRTTGVIALENSGASDPHMLGLQANGWFPVGDDLTVQTSVSYSDWSSTRHGNGKLMPSGNTPGNGGFGILDAFVAGTYGGGPLGRTQGFLQVMRNVDDDSGEDSGFALGAKLGNNKNQGDWSLFGGAFDVDANAIYGPVSQDDTPLPGTGVGDGQSGFIFGTEYTWKKGVGIRVWALATDVEAAEDPFRLRFDVTFNLF